MNAGHILVVDDERTIVQLLRLVLEDLDYEVVAASSIEEARSHFGRGYPFHAAILDKNLREGSGIELGQELRQAMPFCQPILLTGYSNKEAAIAAVSAGFYAYLEKPIDDLQSFGLVVRNAVIKSQMMHRQLESDKLIAQMRKMDALGRLAAGVAHDFNNVLAAISLNAEMLSSGTLSPEESIHTTSEILEVAKSGRALAKQLVMFGRGAAAQAKTVLLSDVVTSMSALTQSVAGQRRLVTQIEASLWHIVGDPDQLSQIVLNLVVNAADATPEGGTLTITLRNTREVPAQIKTQRAVALTVEDTGSGISPHIIDHIFEPYFSTKGDAKGSGLGLATVFGITENHGGVVTASSQEGKGSRFEVFLPVPD